MYVYLINFCRDLSCDLLVYTKLRISIFTKIVHKHYKIYLLYITISHVYLGIIIRKDMESDN